MKTWASVIVVVAIFLTVFSGCDRQTPVEQDRPAIQVTTISSGSLPQNYEKGLLFVYEQAEVNPESLLTELLNADVPVVQAWLPLDNRCMDPTGPRFTIELRQKAELVTKFNFKEGSGRLECATMLQHYVITK